MPTASEQASRKDPPYEKNGSGMPVMGRRFTVIPTFSTMWVNSMPAIPNTHRLENASVARRAIRSSMRVRTANSASAMTTPRNPSSSPTTGKMKSVCWAGRNARRFWGPWVNPLPRKPPDPMAIFDWITCHPVARGSTSGFRNASSRFCW